MLQGIVSLLSMAKCIIIEENRQSGRTLKQYIGREPRLQLQTSYRSLNEALPALFRHSADLVFLDLKKSGSQTLEFLRAANAQVPLIVCAAEKPMAYEALEAGAIDFLARPFSFERFRKAVEKALASTSPVAEKKTGADKKAEEQSFLFIKEGTKIMRVDLDDIYFISGLKNYIAIHTKGGRIISLLTMKEMKDLLPPKRFARVHRSYTVAIDKISSIEKHQIRIRDKTIPIGDMYLEQFMQMLPGLPLHQK